MASLRGGTKVWSAHATNQNDTSAVAIPGPGPYVVVYIDSSVSATFQIQVSTTDKVEAGLNALTAYGLNQDGSLDWFDYSGADTLTVTGGVPIAFDLSPFGPQFIRLKRTDAGATSTVSAWISSFGAN